MQPANEGVENLIDLACALGATASVIIPAGVLVVEDRFAALCAEPFRCPSYGLAPGCPPHATRPEVFREQLRKYQQVLVFKIEAPVAALQGKARLEIAKTIHRIAATIELEAVNRGRSRARGLAAGSCKELFCPQQEACVVLEKKMLCLHATQARPSLSALGVNFTRLAEVAGWQFEKIETNGAAVDAPAMGLMAGMVLLA